MGTGENAMVRTSAERSTARIVGKGIVCASAVAAMLAGCSSGGASEKSAAATGTAPHDQASKSAPAPTATPSPSGSPSHIPVGSGSGTGPSIKVPDYVEAAPAGGALTFKAAASGVETAGDSSAFAARFDPAAVKFVLHTGSVVPGGGGWLAAGGAPTAGLLAGWNGGFLMNNNASWGGFYLGGKTAYGPLKAGTASEVFYKDGTMDVMSWPGGQPSADVVGVRQNLALMISDGKLANDLADGTAADERTWGYTNDSSNEHANRSGVGVTADGKVVYAAVRGASPLQLAQFLQRAGAVRAMELDINMARPIFGTYSGGRWWEPAPWMGPAIRFTGANERDFVVVYGR